MPKLTLRDLFAVVTIVALALGWWVDRSRLAQSAASAQARAKRAEVNASYYEALSDKLSLAISWYQAKYNHPEGDPFAHAHRARFKPVTNLVTQNSALLDTPTAMMAGVTDRLWSFEDLFKELVVRA